MGGKSKPPKQSSEEKALLAQQTKVLQQQLLVMEDQNKQFNLLAPFMFKDLGLKPKMDDKGKIIGFDEIPDELKPLRERSEKLLLERSVAALEGALPVSPQLKQELAESRTNLENTLRKSLGPDFMTSTGGSDAVAKFMREEENVLEAARRGDITLGEQLSIARQAGTSAGNTQTLANLLGLNNQSGIIAQGFGNNAAGYSNPIHAWQNNRQLKMAGSQGGPGIAGALQGFGQLAGTVVGSIYGGPAGGAVGGAAGGAAGGMMGSLFQ